MAKSFEPKGDLARALRTLDSAEEYSAAELRKAISLVHGARNFSPSELETRFAGSSHVALNPETGRLTLVEKPQTPKHESWVAIAGLAAVRTQQAPITFNQTWEGWSKQPQSRVAASMRKLPMGAQRAEYMARQPVVRQAQLATIDHARHRDAFDSFARGSETLQVASTNRKFVQDLHFRDDFATDERDRAFEVYGTDDGALVRRTQLLGSFAREMTLKNEARRTRLTASQSLLMTKQTVFAVDPEWREVLFETDDLATGEYTQINHDVAREFDGLIEAHDETIAPLVSSMYATQDWRVISTQPF